MAWTFGQTATGHWVTDTLPPRYSTPVGVAAISLGLSAVTPPVDLSWPDHFAFFFFQLADAGTVGCGMLFGLARLLAGFVSAHLTNTPSTGKG